jgi:hypothetical protein
MYTSFENIEFELPLAVALSCSQPGKDAEADVWRARQDPKLREALSQLDPEKVKEELRGYGAWDREELEDHETNLGRIVWIAACGIREDLNSALSELVSDFKITEKDKEEILWALS